MCLDIRPSKQAPRVPFDGRNFRWKILKMRGNTLESYYMSHLWDFGKYQQSQGFGNKKPSKDRAFHVYVDCPTVAYLQKLSIWTSCEVVLVRVAVRGFNRAGYFDGVPSETWLEAKVTAVFNKYGDDITERFKS